MPKFKRMCNRCYYFQKPFPSAYHPHFLSRSHSASVRQAFWFPTAFFIGRYNSRFLVVLGPSFNFLTSTHAMKRSAASLEVLAPSELFENTSTTSAAAEQVKDDRDEYEAAQQLREILVTAFLAGGLISFTDTRSFFWASTWLPTFGVSLPCLLCYFVYATLYS